MTAFPDLRSVQSLFWRLLTAPEGAARGAAALQHAGALASEDLSFLVVGDEKLDPVEHLDVYANMYFYRLHDCLAEDFPKLEAHIGAARFHNLATDYLLAHPSTHFSLRELGHELPRFVEQHALASEFPGLADLARLEWARTVVFDEADATPLSRSDLLQRAAAGPDRLGVALVPSARLERLDASVLPIWRRLDAGAAAGADDDTRTTGETRGVLVWRKGFALFHRSLQADEERGLRALAGGASVAELGERILEAQPEGAPPGRAAERLAALLEQWVSDELLTDSLHKDSFRR